MTTKLIFSFSLLLLLLVPNAHQAISHPQHILDMAIPVKTLQRLSLPSNAFGPECTAFDRFGAGPYTGVANGRVLKWSGPSKGFVNFAVTSTNWSKQLCESNDINLEPVCGSALGIEFYKKTNTLYIADGYYNLRSVGPDGGVATLLASSAEGIPFRFLDDIEVDQDTGVVYFTDVSTHFQKKLLKYDPATKQVTVILRGLGAPIGTALSKEGSFVLVSEFVNSRILRYWLKGFKVNTSEIFYVSEGLPDNIKRNANGDFLVAVTTGDAERATIPLGILLDENGKVLRALNFATANISVAVSNVEEYDGKLYIGSLSLDYIGVTRSTIG